MKNDSSGGSPFDHTDRVIDFETIRRQKERERKQKKRILWAAIVVLLLAALTVVAFQILQVTDTTRGFWSNFSSLFPSL